MRKAVCTLITSAVLLLAALAFSACNGSDIESLDINSVGCASIYSESSDSTRGKLSGYINNPKRRPIKEIEITATFLDEEGNTLARKVFAEYLSVAPRSREKFSVGFTIAGNLYDYRVDDLKLIYDNTVVIIVSVSVPCVVAAAVIVIAVLCRMRGSGKRKECKK